jgi:hypothetical protein
MALGSNLNTFDIRFSVNPLFRAAGIRRPLLSGLKLAYLQKRDRGLKEWNFAFQRCPANSEGGASCRNHASSPLAPRRAASKR